MASANNPGPLGERPVGLIASDPGAAQIASRLMAAGKRVIALTLDPGVKFAPAANLERAATVCDIGIECQIILLCVEDSATLRKVLLGDQDRGGLMHDLMCGSTLIDFGMRPARESQSVLGILGLRGTGLVDAALIGSSDAILRGTASVLAGGFPDAVDAAMPVLCELGTVERTGPLGSAQTAAALMGYVETAHMTARSEAIGMGAALGLQSQSLTRLFSETPDPDNVTRLENRARFAHRLIEERGLGGNVIAFRRLGPVEAT